MAYHFSANQFEKPYNAKRLCNWELPKWYPPRPRSHKKPTKVVANNNGHLLCSVERTDKNPWGYFRSTYELPRKITRKFADEYNECLIRKHKWRNFPHKKTVCGKKDEPPKCDDKCETIRRIFTPGEKGIGKCAKGQEKKKTKKKPNKENKAEETCEIIQTPPAC
ncbi:protein Flattop homolog [Ceratitis capitata]|uniref:Cilia- and flagella-associated protein 126 n=1 Tax=Ceratitis capitata TaxID=7213 RepID=W8C3C2_CERCA|nr:protein Flattop homolog [Ceratitis capitata]